MGTLHSPGWNSALMFPVGKKKWKHTGFRKKQKQFLIAVYKKTNFLQELNRGKKSCLGCNTRDTRYHAYQMS